MKKSKDAHNFTKYYQKKDVTGTYDHQREGNVYRRQKRAVELRYFLELIDKKPKENVLELGCSSGFLTKDLGKVTAIDTSTDMLKIARSKNKLAKCMPGDMFDIPFKDNSFDKVDTMRVWNHLGEEDLKKAIKESKRVLKEGGYLIFDSEEKSFLRRIVSFFYKRIFKTTGYKIYQYSLKDLSRILNEQGFKIEKGKFLYHKVGRQIILRNKLFKK